MQQGSEPQGCMRHWSSFRRLRFIHGAKFGLKKSPWTSFVRSENKSTRMEAYSWVTGHTNKPNPCSCTRMGERPVVAHAGSSSEGSFSSQPAWFHEQGGSSFGKPSLHHALVRNRTAAYASGDWHIERGLPYFPEQQLDFLKTSQGLNNLAVLEVKKQTPSLNATAGVRPVSAGPGPCSGTSKVPVGKSYYSVKPINPGEG